MQSREAMSKEPHHPGEELALRIVAVSSISAINVETPFN